MIQKADAKALPSTIGVYIFKRNNNVLYIGKSIDIKKRVLSHIKNAEVDSKERAIIENSDTVDSIVVPTEFHALILESKMIREYMPKYNVIWRDDKSYLYVKIPIKDLYPRVSIVRKENDSSSLYFGPFSSTRNVRFLLRSIRQLIPFCTQKKTIKKPCFYSKIGLCSPCPAGKENDTFLQKQYRSHIEKVVQILSGNLDVLDKQLKREIAYLTEQRRFEEAIVIRNKFLKLEDLIHLRSFDTNEYKREYDPSIAVADLIALLNAINLSIPSLYRIECYDVSNLKQQEATASMVVMTEGIIDKKQYKRFRLKSVKTSDFQMLKEAIQRRFDNKWEIPSLLVVDGGAPQVRIITSFLTQHSVQIPLIGLAKHPDRIVYMKDHVIKTIRPDRHRPGFMLLQQLRDESHRFAKKYHTLLRSKRILV